MINLMGAFRTGLFSLPFSLGPFHGPATLTTPGVISRVTNHTWAFLTPIQNKDRTQWLNSQAIPPAEHLEVRCFCFAGSCESE